MAAPRVASARPKGWWRRRGCVVALPFVVGGVLLGAGCSADLLEPTPPGDTAAVLLGAPGTVPDISGSWVVWTEPIRHARVIVAFNIETGETRRIAQATDLLDRPAIDGTTVVWDGGEDTVMIAVGDVFGTPETLIGPGISPDVSGTYVVFNRVVAFDKVVVLHDLETGEETVLGGGFPGSSPRIDRDRVVWDARPGGSGDPFRIFLYDIGTRTTTVISPPEGTHVQPDISGDWVVWTAGLALAGEDRLQGDILLFNVVTGELRKITDDEATQQHPAIDDGVVVWQDQRNHMDADGARVDLFMYDIQTGREMQLTGPGSFPRRFIPPAVSGRRVVWQESILNRELPNFSILMLELP